jgi:hypothetical protein
MHSIRTKRLGFGDIIEKVTKTTGIKAVVDAASEAIGIPCGCPERKEKLNNPDLLINKILNNVNI